MIVYDVFEDKYIDDTEKEINAPPERYIRVTQDLLIENAARWIVEGLINSETRKAK